MPEFVGRKLALKSRVFRLSREQSSMCMQPTDCIARPARGMPDSLDCAPPSQVLFSYFAGAL